MLTPKKLREQAHLLAKKTSDAYSCDRYNTSWLPCCTMLLREYTFEEAEAILRSKWMRWAADDRRGNYPTSRDLERWMIRNHITIDKVRELLDEE